MDRDGHQRMRVELDVSLGHERQPATPRVDAPFNIAVLGDFSGGNNAASSAPGLNAILVDRDNLDEVLARLAPVLRINMSAAAGRESPAPPGDGASAITVHFRELDDFHPDRLLQRVPALKAVWLLRQRLADARTFERAARELNPPVTPAAEPAPRSVPAGGSVLEDILADVAGPALTPAAPLPEDELRALARQLVAPHLVAGENPRQAALVMQVDGVLTNALRALLHQPQFQALESLWRGIDLMVRRLETSSQLRIYLVDVSKSTLAAELPGNQDLEQTSLHRFIQAGADGAPWALLAGCYTFGPAPDDIKLLERIGRAVHPAGVPFVAAADVRLAGVANIGALAERGGNSEPSDPAWSVLRRSQQAQHIGLALPRFLLRLPYGPDGEPSDVLPFEESGESDVHEDFLWGNPALACALLLGTSFERAGWQLRPGMDLELDRLPLHLTRRDGAAEILPCAESLMSESRATQLLERGFMPLASLKDQAAVRLVRFQSIAEPVAALAGAWSRQS